MKMREEPSCRAAPSSVCFIYFYSFGESFGTFFFFPLIPWKGKKLPQEPYTLLNSP